MMNISLYCKKLNVEFLLLEYTDAAFKEHKEEDDSDFLVLPSEEYAKEQFGFMEFPPVGWIPHSSI